MTIRTRKSYEFADAPPRSGLFWNRATSAFEWKIEGEVIFTLDADGFVPTEEFANDGVAILDTGGDHSVTISPAGNEAADRTLGIPVLGGDDTIMTLGTALAELTPGSGIAGIETYASKVYRNGGFIKTEIIVDLTDLVVDNADLDIIGDDDAANCHFGQITAAINGTIVAGRMTCLEVPAGAGTVVDVDLYSATEGTGTEGVASGVGSLTETALVTSGASWTSGRTLGMTALPAANEYLYLAAGAAGGDSSPFTAGKFLIEFWGT